MSSWAVDMEKKLDDVEQPAKVERWLKHCIFRVPLRFKMAIGGVSCIYKPQTVSLGPFHHGDKDLKPMEEHKLRAVRHLLHRANCKTTLAELIAAVDEVVDELQDAYMDLGEEWQGKENRGKFLEMMITDGCFLLEVMRTVAAVEEKGSILMAMDYMHGDPVFSKHGIQHMKPFVQRDMLMVENQLPLMLLEKIVAAEEGKAPSTASINFMVLKFLESEDVPEGINLGLHPLDIYRTSLLNAGMKTKGDKQGQRHPQGLLKIKSWMCSCFKAHQQNIHRDRGVETEMGAPRLPRTNNPQRVVPRSAWKLSEAGIRFVPSSTRCLDDIDLDSWTLYMPKLLIDDSTAYKFHNMMVFEAMHVGTRNDVTAYVLFVKDLMDSADDVRLLVKKMILENDLADDNAAVVRLFNDLTRDVYKNRRSQLCRVRDDLEHHYINHRACVNMYEWWAHLRSNYFRSPWTVLALLTAVLFLIGDIVQSVYAVKGYDPKDHGKAKPKMN
ncbi:UPF0481 protein At3g47200-like [Aegilops tauschii subsp. strangulata]|uniref:UPF0481 protein At3g47200-like n=1 Tax=Aegilops tauschii subsp. strangulata TaxID=200361 RepID=UPI001E1CABC8|nr:UPF0481 protein At3g47200-like [Aegilops tauschii subsp. strangulata]